jgi:hypothetical protein
MPRGPGALKNGESWVWKSDSEGCEKRWSWSEKVGVVQVKMRSGRRNGPVYFTSILTLDGSVLRRFVSAKPEVDVNNTFPVIFEKIFKTVMIHYLDKNANIYATLFGKMIF